MPEPRDAEPVLDIARGDKALSLHLRQALGVLRDRTDDKEFRRQLDEVLAGRRSLREAALTGIFERGLTPHFEQGIRRWRELSDVERDRLAQEGQATLDRLDAEIGEEASEAEHPTPPPPPTVSQPTRPQTVLPTVQDAGWFPRPSEDDPPGTH